MFDWQVPPETIKPGLEKAYIPVPALSDTTAKVVDAFLAGRVSGNPAATLADLGTKRAFVVHGRGGLDEISLAGPTIVVEVHDGAVRKFSVTPEEFGMEPAPLAAVRGGTAAENAELIQRILEGEAGPPRDIVVINAAAALVAAGVSENFRDGAEVAGFAIDSGKASKTLASLKAFTNAS